MVARRMILAVAVFWRPVTGSEVLLTVTLLNLFSILHPTDDGNQAKMAHALDIGVRASFLNS